MWDKIQLQTGQTGEAFVRRTQCNVNVCLSFEKKNQIYILTSLIDVSFFFVIQKDSMHGCHIRYAYIRVYVLYIELQCFFSFCPNLLIFPFISICDISVCIGNFDSIVRVGSPWKKLHGKSMGPSLSILLSFYDIVELQQCKLKI